MTHSNCTLSMLGATLALLSAAILIGASVLGDHGSIIIRHDRPDSAYVALGATAPGLAHLNLPDGDGTLIHERWVLTAAHVAVEVRPGHELTVGGRKVAAEAVILHPSWNRAEYDIALIRLRDPVRDVRAVPLYTGREEVGEVVLLAGTGDFGTGLTGPQGNDGRVRGATNRVAGANTLRLWWNFSAPDDPDVTELEGISGPGDSGGPAYLAVDGRYYLVGVSSSQDRRGGPEGLYGVTEYYTRVSSYIGWISEHVGRGD